jgi:clostripain
MAKGSPRNIAGERLWTVMVYLAGDNNLSSEMIYSIKEMKKVEGVGPDGPVTVLVLFDPPPGLPAQVYAVNHGDKDNQLIHEANLAASVNGKSTKGVPTKTLVINPNGDFKTEDINTGDPGTLYQFINIGIDNYEAENYMVVLSGHGSGADQDFLLKDDSSRDSLTINELKKVFTEVKQKLSKKKPGRAIDILGLDSCLMSMAEVYYELANIEKQDPSLSDLMDTDTTLGNTVDFLVGAEGFELSAGWPYERILSALVRNPKMDAETFAKNIVETYVLYYSDYALSGQSVDLAACDLRDGRCDDLKQSIALLADKLRKNLKYNKVKDAILLAHWEAQSYKFDQYTDLVDFCNLLMGRCNNKGIVKACEGVKAAICNDNRIVKKSCYSGPAVQYSYGLSIYFPWARVSPLYKLLDFARGTGWHEFLEEYVKATRRKPRNKGCLSASGPIKGQVFNPPFDEIVISPDGSIPAGIKFTDPFDRFTDPFDRGMSNGGGSMKNPPIKWCPSDCTGNGKNRNKLNRISNDK